MAFWGRKKRGEPRRTAVGALWLFPTDQHLNQFKIALRQNPNAIPEDFGGTQLTSEVPIPSEENRVSWKDLFHLSEEQFKSYCKQASGKALVIISRYLELPGTLYFNPVFIHEGLDLPATPVYTVVDGTNNDIVFSIRIPDPDGKREYAVAIVQFATIPEFEGFARMHGKPIGLQVHEGKINVGTNGVLPRQDPTNIVEGRRVHSNETVQIHVNKALFAHDARKILVVAGARIDQPDEWWYHEQSLTAPPSAEEMDYGETFKRSLAEARGSLEQAEAGIHELTGKLGKQYAKANEEQSMAIGQLISTAERLLTTAEGVLPNMRGLGDNITETYRHYLEIIQERHQAIDAMHEKLDGRIAVRKLIEEWLRKDRIPQNQRAKAYFENLGSLEEREHEFRHFLPLIDIIEQKYPDAGVFNPHEAWTQFGEEFTRIVNNVLLLPDCTINGTVRLKKIKPDGSFEYTHPGKEVRLYMVPSGEQPNWSEKSAYHSTGVDGAYNITWNGEHALITIAGAVDIPNEGTYIGTYPDAIDTTDRKREGVDFDLELNRDLRPSGTLPDFEEFGIPDLPDAPNAPSTDEVQLRNDLEILGKGIETADIPALRLIADALTRIRATIKELTDEQLFAIMPKMEEVGRILDESEQNIKMFKLKGALRDQNAAMQRTLAEAKTIVGEVQRWEQLLGPEYDTHKRSINQRLREIITLLESEYTQLTVSSPLPELIEAVLAHLRSAASNKQVTRLRNAVDKMELNVRRYLLQLQQLDQLNSSCTKALEDLQPWLTGLRQAVRAALARRKIA